MNGKMLQLILFLQCHGVIGQVIPTKFIFNTADVVTLNGSSPTGKCSNTWENVDNTITCLDPTSSVLFDGYIPTLTGLQGNMWASHLLSLRAPTILTFDFTGQQDFFSIQKIEIVLFNCAEWEASIFNIAAGGSISFHPSLFSCNHLVTACVSRIAAGSLFSLSFTPDQGNWVHIAEVMFYQRSSECQPDTILTAATFTTTTPVPGTTTTPLPGTTTTPLPGTTTTPLPGTTTTPLPGTTTTPLPGTTTTPLPGTTTTPLPDVLITPSPPETTITITTFKMAPSAAPAASAILPTLSTSLQTFASSSADAVATSDTSNLENDGMQFIIISIVLLLLAIILVCVVVTLLLWRCYFVKKSVNISKVEHESNKHNPGSLHQKVDHSTVSQLQLKPDSNEMPIIPDLSETEMLSDPMYDTAERAVDGSGIRSPNQAEFVTDTDSLPAIATDLLYAKVDKEKVKAQILSTDQLYAEIDKSVIAKTSSPLSFNASAAVDQLYAQVDKSKSQNVFTSLKEVTAVDELYAHVDKTSKKKEKGEETMPLISEDVVEVNQIYAQVDKQKKAVSADNSLDVYSVVNKPKTPQLPPKLDLLIEEEFIPPQVPPKLADDETTQLPPMSDFVALENEHSPPPMSDYTVADEFVPPQVPAMSKYDMNDEPVSQWPSTSDPLVDEESPPQLPSTPGKPTGKVISYDNTL